MGIHNLHVQGSSFRTNIFRGGLKLNPVIFPGFGAQASCKLPTRSAWNGWKDSFTSYLRKVCIVAWEALNCNQVFMDLGLLEWIWMSSLQGKLPIVRVFFTY